MLTPAHKLLNAIEQAGILQLALVDCFFSHLMNFGQISKPEDLEFLISTAINEVLANQDAAGTIDTSRSHLTVEEVQAIVIDASNASKEAALEMQVLRQERDAAKSLLKFYRNAYHSKADSVTNISRETKDGEREAFLKRLK